jgi:hypothetical protein
MVRICDVLRTKAAGVKALLANVDSVHAVHSVRHLREVAAALRTAVAGTRPGPADADRSGAYARRSGIDR